MRGYPKGLVGAMALIVVLLAAAAVFLLPWRGGTGKADPTAGPGQGTRGGGGDPFRVAEGYLRTRRGQVTAAAEDLRTGQTWTLGDGRPQDEASVVKLDILQALLARDPGGPPAAQRALAKKMITVSDNDAATALWNADGGATGIGSYNTAAGLARTRLSACVACPRFPWPGWGLSTTTPADQVALLRQLVAPGKLPAAARGYALTLLENITSSQRFGVSSGVPAGVTVALKNGWLPLNAANTDWQVNSVGWVSGDGRDYLLVILSTGNPSEQYGITTVDRIGALAWSALGSLQFPGGVGAEPVLAREGVPELGELLLVGRCGVVGGGGRLQVGVVSRLARLAAVLQRRRPARVVRVGLG
ncbi:MAG TPA: serine hydrolase [Trebonia sp.]